MGKKINFKVVEEWGCNLGEDAFMTKVEPETTSEVLSHSKDVEGLEEVQGEWELDDLVTDLHKEWSEHAIKKVVFDKSNASVPNDSVEREHGADFFEVNLSPILQPLPKQTTNAGVLNGEIRQKGLEKRLNDTTTKGPWSAEWLST